MVAVVLMISTVLVGRLILVSADHRFLLETMFVRTFVGGTTFE